MKNRIKISSGTKWESFVGYSRAVRIGNIVEVSGTIAVDDHGNPVGNGDPYKQTIFILNKIKKAIEDAGGTIQDVVRTRMYVKDISQWEAIGKAHGEFFKEIRPSSTMVEVSALVGAEYLLEIEASAVLESFD